MVTHFVGFKGEEYHAAVRVWGQPDVVHRWADARFWHGGEVDFDHDVIVFANQEDQNTYEYSFNDSAVF